MEIEKIEVYQYEILNEVFSIYESSFPANERQSLETLKIRLKQDKEVLFAAKLKNEIVGIGFLFDLIGSDFLLLDYLAVKENHRGKKIGEMLFEFLKSYAKSHNKHLLMEVDDPAACGEDKMSKLKRIAFYQKNGALWLQDVKYILPALDGTNPTEQILMIAPFGGKTQFNGIEIKSLAKILYRDLYGIGAENNDLGFVLKSINERVIAVDYQEENYF